MNDVSVVIDKLSPRSGRTKRFGTEPLAVASGSPRAREFFAPMTYDPVATAPGSVTFLSPVSRAYPSHVLTALPALKVLGFFRAVRFADFIADGLMKNSWRGLAGRTLAPGACCLLLAAFCLLLSAY